MDGKTDDILAYGLLQSNEVESSNAMELENLKKILRFLKEKGIKIKSLTTDRHTSVKKYMRTFYGHIKHYIDIWHVDKGIKKKLKKLCQQKKAKCLLPWIPSISRHLYWCAMSSGENKQLAVEKWKSMVNHMTNVHTHKGFKK